MTHTTPCACGGIIRANPDDPVPAMREHNASPLHLAWRAERRESPPLARILLGPVPCHGCGRSLTWNGYVWRDAIEQLRHRCRERIAV